MKTYRILFSYWTMLQFKWVLGSSICKNVTFVVKLNFRGNFGQLATQAVEFWAYFGRRTCNKFLAANF